MWIQAFLSNFDESKTYLFLQHFFLKILPLPFWIDQQVCIYRIRPKWAGCDKSYFLNEVEMVRSQSVISHKMVAKPVLET